MASIIGGAVGKSVSATVNGMASVFSMVSHFSDFVFCLFRTLLKSYMLFPFVTFLTYKLYQTNRLFRIFLL